MPQVFSRSANTISRVSIVAIALLAIAAIAAIMGFDRSDYNTEVGYAKTQPIQFSHQHHNGQLGIHCGYCHTSVEVSSFAGIPSTHTCMSCHSQIWINAPILEPVRASYRTDQSLHWVRVHDLPDFVYFDHSIHVNKGVGCATCHGRVDHMTQVYKVASLQMEWCLDCHREPWKNLRPRDQIYSMTYQPPANQEELGRRLMKEYNVRSLLDCYTCHR
jgi:hypothetical protein